MNESSEMIWVTKIDSSLVSIGSLFSGTGEYSRRSQKKEIEAHFALER